MTHIGENNMDFTVVEDTDLDAYKRISTPRKSPLIDALMDGKRRFVPFKDEREKTALGGLYTAANRRQKKCSMTQVTNADGVKGFLIQFRPDTEETK